MATNNRLTKFSGLSQARIGDHHKPNCGNHLGLTRLPRDLNNNTGYCIFLSDTKFHR
jgi:hypothetical protein